MQKNSTFFAPQAGIAIGPILFVVAILAVLVGALAAGSGGFGSSTANDANRVNGSTLIEQGTNIKTASDRLLVNGYLPTDEYLSPLYSADPQAAMYSPTGGGMTVQNPPSNTVAPSAAWTFAQANLPGIGTTGNNDLIVYIQVKTDTVCKAINGVIFGSTAAQATTVPVEATPANITYNVMTNTCSDIKITSSSTGCALASNKFDISDITTMTGRVQGCITDGTNFYYYQLLSAG